MSLETIYQWIDQAEDYVATRSFSKAAQKYELAQRDISKVLESLEQEKTKLDENLYLVVQALADEINSRLSKISRLNQKLNKLHQQSNDDNKSTVRQENPFANSSLGTDNSKNILDTEDKNQISDLNEGNELMTLGDAVLDGIINQLYAGLSKTIPSVNNSALKREINKHKVRIASHILKVQNAQSLREQLLIEENRDLKQYSEKLAARWESMKENTKQK
ncbi:hypothetical protein ACO0RG_004253 [Hanseniaspora osmophila]|uniref:Uncharacterized protein n=1 Tax=Hanseniaspora osmophila TaxID=56408 RepID=A0A1E5RBT4_9ASCO|nr:hypothetical protein AWRI3579_g2877 [Hanseniaspora osmophila]